LQLGGNPSPRIQLNLDGRRYSGQQAIAEALLFEQAALDGYRDLLEQVDSSGDVVLEEFARQQVAVESEHVSQLQMLLVESPVGDQ
jgi:bacterioferritin (cytochrome b1)